MSANWQHAFCPAMLKPATGWSGHNLRLSSQHCPRIRRKGPHLCDDLVSRREHGAAPRRRGLRPDDEHAIQHLRELLDQAEHQAGDYQHRQDDPHSRLHGRTAHQVAAGNQQAAPTNSAAHRHKKRSPSSSGLSKKKLAIIKKAIRVANAGSQARLRAKRAGSIEEMLTDSRGKAPDDEMGETDDLKQVMYLLAKMDPREATVLRMRFWLDDEEPKTLKEIGEQSARLTRERVRQIENERSPKLNDGLAV